MSGPAKALNYKVTITFPPQLFVHDLFHILFSESFSIVFIDSHRSLNTQDDSLSLGLRSFFLNGNFNVFNIFTNPTATDFIDEQLTQFLSMCLLKSGALPVDKELFGSFIIPVH